MFGVFPGQVFPREHHTGRKFGHQDDPQDEPAREKNSGNQPRYEHTADGLFCQHAIDDQ